MNRPQLQRADLTDKQYEAFSKACQFIYDMNMKYIYGKNADNKKEAEC